MLFQFMKGKKSSTPYLMIKATIIPAGEWIMWFHHGCDHHKCDDHIDQCCEVGLPDESINVDHQVNNCQIVNSLLNSIRYNLAMPL